MRKRDDIILTTIVLILFALGKFVSQSYQDAAEKTAQEYTSAARITTKEELETAIHASTENVFITGSMEAVRPVVLPELDGQYICVQKVEKKLNKHARVYSPTFITWQSTWDTEKMETYSTDQVQMFGEKIDYKNIQMPKMAYLTTIQETENTRVQYYGIQEDYTGTLYATLDNGTIVGKSYFWNEKDVEKIIQEEADYNAFDFWKHWILLSILVVSLVVFLLNIFFDEDTEYEDIQVWRR